jgi:hypothetical protein
MQNCSPGQVCGLCNSVTLAPTFHTPVKDLPKGGVEGAKAEPTC